jgi:hypothetical protein
MYIENIAKTISKHLGIVRRLKFKMNRQDLEKMCQVYTENNIIYVILLPCL